jgi:hypothetical protein
MERLVAPKMQIVPPALTVVNVERKKTAAKKRRKRRPKFPPVLMPPARSGYITIGDYDCF